MSTLTVAEYFNRKNSPGAALAYRSAVVAPDVIAVPGTVTCTKQAGGGLTANTYNIKVVAGNAYGRTTPKTGNATVVTETTNLTARAAFAAVVGASFYDIYCSTDSDPKWVGRITEAQRATGIKLTAVGVTGAGGTAGAVDIEAVGTGLQAATTQAVSTAYSVPASPINCAGFQFCAFDLSFSRTGDAVVLACTVVPFLYNARTQTYFAGTPVALTFGGTAGVYQPFQQRLTIEVNGNPSVALLVETISGTGASLDVDYTLF